MTNSTARNNPDEIAKFSDYASVCKQSTTTSPGWRTAGRPSGGRTPTRFTFTTMWEEGRAEGEVGITKGDGKGRGREATQTQI